MKRRTNAASSSCKALLFLFLALDGRSTTAAPTALEKVRQALRAGAPARAEKLLSEELSRSPNDPLLLYTLGNLHLSRGDARSAEAVLKRAIARPSPIAALAGIALAKAYALSGQQGESLSLFQKLRSAKLPPVVKAEVAKGFEEFLDLLLQQAKAESSQRRTEQALKLYRLLKEADPSPEAALMVGISLVELGRTEEAKKALAELAAEASAGQAALDAKALLAKLRAEEEAVSPRYMIYAEATGGVDTNFRANGSELPREKRGTFSTTLGGSRILLESLRTRLRFDLSGRWEEVVGLTGERQLQLSTALPLEWQAARRWTLRFQPGVRYSLLGGEPFLLRAGAQTSLSYSQSRSVISGGFVADRNLARTSGYSYLSGSTYSAYLSFVRQWSAILLELTGGGSIEDSGDLGSADGSTVLPLAYKGFSWTAAISWLPNSSWKLGIESGLARKYFKTPSQPQSIRREDRLILAGVRVTRSFSGGFSTFLGVSAQQNASSLGFNTASNRNFERVIAQLGLSWIGPKSP